MHGTHIQSTLLTIASDHTCNCVTVYMYNYYNEKHLSATLPASQFIQSTLLGSEDTTQCLQLMASTCKYTGQLVYH